LRIILGIILSYIVHGAIEIIYLKTANEIIWSMHWGFAPCSLPPLIAYMLPLVGIIGGYYLVKFWWQIMYVEKKHWSFNKEDQLTKQ